MGQILTFAASPRESSVTGKTALLLASQNGPSIGIPFKQDGNTALINAIRADAFKVVEALIKGGASMLIIDEVSGYMA